MLIFKVGSLARQLNVHRNTITNWIKKGRLPATSSTAKRYVISKNAFCYFCEKQKISKKLMESVVLEISAQPEKQDQTPLSGAVPGSENAIPLPGIKDRIGSVMVVGGGIAGIQAALDLANSGFFVYLIEKTAGIGGTMGRLDKTFPTNDCASCILLPKLVECGRHLNIELITLAQVEQVGGNAGHFTIQVRKDPRYIDMDKCIACGICAQKCPINVSDEFNYGINKKKAVYIKCDQSVPLKYAIDPSACIYFTLGKCKACEKFCPTGAVNFSQVQERVTLHVGAVILAPGFKPFDPSPHDFFGRNITDVVTSLEYERLLSVSGPNRGALRRLSDNLEPRKIAWLQCVGSRNHNNCGNSYCSNICCMAAVKQSMASWEHIKGRHLDRAIFFMDLRSHGKESEKYFEKAKQMGIRFVRAFPHTIEPGEYNTGVRLRYVDAKGEVVVEAFDMAVLSIGFEAPGDVTSLARQFDIALDPHQFASTSCFEPVKSSRGGVYVVGAFNSPKAIPRSVVQASAAAASVSTLLAEQRGTLTKTKLYPLERDISGEEPRVGVFVCSCGVNIAGIVDVDQVVAYAAQLPQVTCVENNLFSCSADAQASITEKIHEFGLNRIVIAACTPRTHEHMFQETLKNAQLNGFMVEMANIRNQNSWVHQKDSKSATRKAKDQVRMAVAKVAHNTPLNQERIKVTQTALVVGGGIVGMNSALTIAGLGIETILIEKSDLLGGNAIELERCFNDELIRPMLEILIRRVNANKQIRIYKQAILESVSGSVGNFTGILNLAGKPEKIQFGAAVMATGAKEAPPSEYHYATDSRVMSQMEFDARVLYRAPLAETTSVVFIQCVGSREPERPYCSRVCCIHSVKAAIALKKINSAIKVHILYRDMRTYGEWEAYYKDARDLGVVFIRYETDRKPEVQSGKNNLRVEVLDPVIQCSIKITADYLVLASGIIAHDNKHLADLFKFTVNSDGFFNGAHPKLKPVDLPVAGLFLAGLCNYPKPIDESIEQARAVGFRVSQLLLQKQITSEAIKSFVTDKCDGCAFCIDVCPFHALSLGPLQKNLGYRVISDPALCQGCGLCAATCPNEGIMVHGFTMEQLKAQVRAAVNESVFPKGNPNTLDHGAP